MSIKLDPPKITGEFMTALQNRRTQRDMNGTDLTKEELSDLLWVIYGNNREHDSRKPHTFLAYKTVPSACALYPLEVCVLLKTGAYKYDADKHELILIKEGDFTEKGIAQDFVKNGTNFYFFWNKTIYETCPIAGCESFLNTGNNGIKMAAMDCGIISQNIYVYCAVHGLKTCVRGMLGDVKFFKDLFGYGDDYEMMFGQTVGH